MTGSMQDLYVPLPVCASATSASATKNSSFDTRGRVLTRLTIFGYRNAGGNEHIDRSYEGGNRRKTEETESHESENEQREVVWG
jgi:hypothetical protein